MNLLLAVLCGAASLLATAFAVLGALFAAVAPSSTSPSWAIFGTLWTFATITAVAGSSHYLSCAVREK